MIQQKAAKRNLRILKNTVSSIVREMNPAVLCFCEVGTATQSLTELVMRTLTGVVKTTWSAAATEHGDPDIQFHYAVGSPYVTAWVANQCKSLLQSTAAERRRVEKKKKHR